MNTVKIYNVGPDELSERDCPNFEWVVAYYESGDYDGSGEAVSFDGLQYRHHGLGHCSCYGPEDGMESGDVVSLDAILGDSVVPGLEIQKEIVDKVRELLGK